MRTEEEKSGKNETGKSGEGGAAVKVCTGADPPIEEPPGTHDASPGVIIKTDSGHSHLPHPGAAPVARHLGGGAELVGQIDHKSLPAAGHPPGQGPHVGDDDILLLGGEPPAEGLGVSEGELGVVEALVTGMGGAVLGIVEVQVVEQAAPGRRHIVQIPPPGQPEGDIGHEDRVLIAAGAGVVRDAFHGADLVGGEEISHAGDEALPIDIVDNRHGQFTFLRACRRG